MINLYNQVPLVYSQTSRDFQYLSWLVNIVLNSVKHNVDDIYDLPDSKADPRLTELLAMTLGFKVRRDYDKDQLMALVGLMPRILKYKGTEKAIRLAGEALIRTSGAAGRFNVTVKGGTIEILLPKNLVDITLFLDLLPYILPAGMTCKIVRRTEIEGIFSTDVAIDSTMIAKLQKDVHFDIDYKDGVESEQLNGASALYDVGNNDADFTNFDKDEQFIQGLFGNAVIPTLEHTILDQPSTEDKKTGDENK